MKIPFLDLKLQYQLIKEEVEKKIEELLATQQFILGEEGKKLEEELADFCQVKFAVGVSSGTDALLISMMALDFQPGEAILTTPFTFIATGGSPARLGLKVIFADIDPQSINLDPDSVEEVLAERQRKERIRALIPVHLFGQMVEMDPIMELARKYDLNLIEDAAQAIGAEYPGKEGILKAGASGDAGVLSFFPSKNLGGAGDGGMVLTNSHQLRERLIALRNHGSQQRYLHAWLGGNFRLDEIQAAVLRIKLKYLSQWIKERQEKAAYYTQLFQDSKLAEEGIVIAPPAQYENKNIVNFHTYHQYVVRVQQRDELRQYLLEKGVATAIYYPIPLHLQPCFQYLGYKKGDFPCAEQASSEVLALPIYPEIPASHQEYVVDQIKEFYWG